MEIPAQSQDLNLGDNKTAGDIIGADFAASFDGRAVKLEGTVKPVTTAWTAYQKSGNNTGHFVPIKLPKKCQDHEVTVKGRKDGDRTVTVDSDLLLIMRLENLSSTTATLVMGDEQIAVLDFTGVVPVGQAAYDPEKTDFGRWGQLADYVDGLNIRWSGNTGYVSGTIKYHPAIDSGVKLAAGNYFPFGLVAYYADGLKRKINGTNKTDKDIIFKVAKDGKCKVEYDDYTVLIFDFSNATLAPKG